MMTENRRDPGGATQTLVPRPRPATCVEAVKVKPVGNLVLIFGFLSFSISAFVVVYIFMGKAKGQRDALLQECVGARHHISIQ